MVSVSRRAGPPHSGQATSAQVGCDASGDWPPPGRRSMPSGSGSSTGRSDSGTATTPHEGQCTIGIGAPQ